MPLNLSGGTQLGEPFSAIQERNADTFGKDIQVLAKNKLTFEEALASPDWQIMARQRLRTVQRDLFEQLEAVGL